MMLGALAALCASGCQTYFGGMTLPSPHYLKHLPQYFPPDPAFPLQRELDSMTDPDGATRRSGGAAVPVPAAAPGAATGIPAGR
jgi:hypothetical protein